MKTLRFIGMALFAVLMCVNLASCSKEELPQYELITNGKKITKIEISDPYTELSIWNFKYDKAGKLIEITCNDGHNTNKYNYTWSKNAINTYILSDGLISKNDYREVSYSNQTGRPCDIKSPSSYAYNYNFVWDSNTGGLSRRGIYYKEGNLSNITELFTFGYSNDVMTCANYNPIIPILLSDGFDGDFLCVAHPELVNARTTVLPNKFTLENFWLDDNGRFDSEKIRGTCNYKFDSDGYITECTMNENSNNYYAYKAKYTIAWE